MYSIRNVRESDLEQLISLYGRYGRETLGIEPTLTADTVMRDGFGAAFDFVVAEAADSGTIVGFAAWQKSYDLHWGISGGIVLDLYVEPVHRCHGLAPRMVQKVAAIIMSKGGTFMAGQGIDGPTHPARMYQKHAVGCPGVECILGGRAFRAFAALGAASMREFVKGLPPKEWNYAVQGPGGTGAPPPSATSPCPDP